jgi:hypothetical protein
MIGERSGAIEAYFAVTDPHPPPIVRGVRIGRGSAAIPGLAGTV